MAVRGAAGTTVNDDSTTPGVPSGLRALLEAVAREAIRAQPSDVVHFVKFFIDELDAYRNAQPGVDVTTDPVAYEIFRTDVQRKYADTVLRANRQQFRPASPDEAATRIQAVFRGHVVRKNIQRSPGGGDMTRTRSNDKMEEFDNNKDLKRHSIGGYQLSNGTSTPEDRAATKIQAEIRGYLTRKRVENMKKENNQAATKIQAGVRGFLTRRRLTHQGVMPSSGRSSALSDENVQ